MKRRSFLKSTGLAAGSLMVPGFLTALDRNSYGDLSGKRLVVIQLSGGCDGLSAAVPYTNDIYYRHRKRTAIEASTVLKLDDEMGFNPVMNGMYSLYQEGWMTIFNNVGYPNANRSHFRSMDIWQSASDSDEYMNTGWIGRYLDHTCNGACEAHRALEIDDTLSLAMKGKASNGMAIRDVAMLQRAIQTGRLRPLADQAANHIDHPDLDFLYKTLASTSSSIDYLKERHGLYRSKRSYPTGAFGKQLKTIGELICSGVNTSIYYSSLGGFDTHAGQRNVLDRLLTELSDGLTALTRDLDNNGQLDDTLIIVFSEFGRRVADNASGGTDHGAGNNLYVIGGRLKAPGIFNGPTDLDELDDGDVKGNLDFRRIYAEVLSDWLDVDDTKILNRAYLKPGFLF